MYIYVHSYHNNNKKYDVSVGPEVMYQGISHMFWSVTGAISDGNSLRLRIIAITDML